MKEPVSVAMNKKDRDTVSRERKERREGAEMTKLNMHTESRRGIIAPPGEEVNYQLLKHVGL